VAADSPTSRERIEGAAREEFASHGFHGARVARIAARSGLNKQLIYYYFGSKRHLHEHLVQQGSEALRLEPALRRSLPGIPSDRLRTLLQTILDRVTASPDLARSVLLGEAAAPGADTAGRAFADLVSEIAREVSRGQGLGYYRDAADPALLGQQAVALLLGWGVMKATSGSRAGPDAEAWAAATADLLSRSLSW
jgi:TetR/AcrR family transcriptional regulator